MKNSPATRIAPALGAAAIAGAATLCPLTAQDATFDYDRALISNEQLFAPFHVTDEDARPLARVLEEGLLLPETWLVVVDHEMGAIALVMDQMAYHHVAQGELSGEPWMVSY